MALALTISACSSSGGPAASSLPRAPEQLTEVSSRSPESATAAEPDFAQLSRSVGQVSVTLCNGGSGTGSSFVVGTNLLVTANHVVSDATRISVHVAGNEFLASVVARSPARDIALLEVDGTLPADGLTFSVALPSVGDAVFALGYPAGLSQTLTAGRVSGFQDLGDLSAELRGSVLQVDAAVNPGNSGGPVLDSSGAVVGMVTAKLDGYEALGFAIPARDVVGLLDDHAAGAPTGAAADCTAQVSVRDIDWLSRTYPLECDGLLLVVDVVAGSWSSEAGERLVTLDVVFVDVDGDSAEDAVIQLVCEWEVESTAGTVIVMTGSSGVDATQVGSPLSGYNARQAPAPDGAIWVESFGADGVVRTTWRYLSDVQDWVIAESFTHREFAPSGGLPEHVQSAANSFVFSWWHGNRDLLEVIAVDDSTADRAWAILPTDQTFAPNQKPQGCRMVSGNAGECRYLDGYTELVVSLDTRCAIPTSGPAADCVTEMWVAVLD